jgi:hypothetical protein
VDEGGGGGGERPAKHDAEVRRLLVKLDEGTHPADDEAAAARARKENLI